MWCFVVEEIPVGSVLRVQSTCLALTSLERQTPANFSYYSQIVTLCFPVNTQWLHWGSPFPCSPDATLLFPSSSSHTGDTEQSCSCRWFAPPHPRHPLYFEVCRNALSSSFAVNIIHGVLALLSSCSVSFYMGNWSD